MENPEKLETEGVWTHEEQDNISRLKNAEIKDLLLNSTTEDLQSLKSKKSILTGKSERPITTTYNAIHGVLAGKKIVVTSDNRYYISFFKEHKVEVDGATLFIATDDSKKEIDIENFLDGEILYSMLSKHASAE